MAAVLETGKRHNTANATAGVVVQGGWNAEPAGRKSEIEQNVDASGSCVQERVLRGGGGGGGGGGWRANNNQLTGPTTQLRAASSEKKKKNKLSPAAQQRDAEWS